MAKIIRMFYAGCILNFPHIRIAGEIGFFPRFNLKKNMEFPDKDIRSVPTFLIFGALQNIFFNENPCCF